MKAGGILNGGVLFAAVLVVVIIAAGVVIGSKLDGGRPVEISLPPSPELLGNIRIGGEVNNPGIYPVRPGDTLADIVRAAGGLSGNASPDYIELTVPGRGEVAQLQKVNINTADTWLLAALPGIGDVRAQAIVAYRQQYGLFRDINELLRVEGIGTLTLDNIKDLVTVGD